MWGLITHRLTNTLELFPDFRHTSFPDGSRRLIEVVEQPQVPPKPIQSTEIVNSPEANILVGLASSSMRCMYPKADRGVEGSPIRLFQGNKLHISHILHIFIIRGGNYNYNRHRNDENQINNLTVTRPREVMIDSSFK